MSHTISDSVGKPKMFHHQFSVTMSLIERSILQFYAQKSGKDNVKVLRNMIRRYVQLDSTWDTEKFQKWAAKRLIAQEDDADTKAKLKDEVARVVEIIGLDGRE